MNLLPTKLLMNLGGYQGRPSPSRTCIGSELYSQTSVPCFRPHRAVKLWSLKLWDTGQKEIVKPPYTFLVYPDNFFT